MPPSDDFIRKCELVEVVDGDTLRLKVGLGWGAVITTDVRLVGVDTPEARGIESPAGKFVEEQVKSWIGDATEVVIHSQEFTVGKFGRCLCEVWVNGLSLNKWLLDSGLGWQTDGAGRVIGPRSVERLTLPGKVKDEVAKAFKR